MISGRKEQAKSPKPDDDDDDELNLPPITDQLKEYRTLGQTI